MWFAAFNPELKLTNTWIHAGTCLTPCSKAVHSAQKEDCRLPWWLWRLAQITAFTGPKGIMMLVNNNHPRKETSILRSVCFSTHSSWSIANWGSKNFGVQEGWIKSTPKDMLERYLGGLTPVKHAEKQIPMTSWPSQAWRTQRFSSFPQVTLWSKADLPSSWKASFRAPYLQALPLLSDW